MSESVLFPNQRGENQVETIISEGGVEPPPITPVYPAADVEEPVLELHGTANEDDVGQDDVSAELLPSAEDMSHESSDFVLFDETVESSLEEHTETATEQLKEIVPNLVEEHEGEDTPLISPPRVGINGDGLFEAMAAEENVPLEQIVTTRNVTPSSYLDTYVPPVSKPVVEKEGGRDIMYIGGGALLLILVILLLIWVL